MAKPTSVHCKDEWHIHTDSKCPIWFVNCFWHLNVGNRSIVLNFYLQRPVFALKIHPRPQRPKRPMKAKKGHQRPDLQKSLISSIFHVKSCINGNLILWKSCFSKIGNFHFHKIKFWKLHFVKNIKIAGFCRWNDQYIHWYPDFMKQLSFHPQVSPNWVKKCVSS